MDVALPAPAPVPAVPRNVLIAVGVLALHAAALWALQSGLLRRAAEVVVPVQILSTVMAPPAPPAAQPAPEKPPEPLPAAPRAKVAPAPAPRPVPRAPVPVAAPSPVPAPAPAPVTASADPQPPAPPVPAPVAAAPSPAPAPAATTAVRLPSTDADYLHNPLPVYPAMSRRLREEGTTVVKVLIGPDGRAQDAQVLKSSGFTRLDQAAEATARGWRYVPGTRGGVAEPMWVEVPIRWQLNKE